MKPTPAIVQPAVDLVKLTHQWEMLCGREERTEKTLAEVRLEKGRLLKQARGAFPTTGNDGAWSKHLAKWNIPDRTARDYMRLAGYVESTSAKHAEAETDNETEAVPTYAQAGIVKSKVEPSTRAIESKENTSPTKPSTTDVDDPEQYRISYLIRAEQAVEFADMTIPMIREFYELKPKRKKDHKELVDWARRAADAWTRLANQLEQE